MKFYTYAHFTADTKELFYIGKGSHKRAWDKSHRNTYWKRKERKQGLIVEVLAYWETEDECFEHEKFLITTFKEKGLAVCNLTNGGEGLCGHVFSDSHKKLIGAAHKGKKKTEEQVAKMRTTMLEKMANNEHREAIRKALTGRTLSEEHKKKIKQSCTTAKAVLCVETGIVYISAKEAQRSLGMSSSSTITACCRGRRKTCGGYTWKYEECK
jgi:hypothetical protein